MPENTRYKLLWEARRVRSVTNSVLEIASRVVCGLRNQKCRPSFPPHCRLLNCIFCTALCRLEKFLSTSLDHIFPSSQIFSIIISFPHSFPSPDWTDKKPFLISTIFPQDTMTSPRYLPFPVFHRAHWQVLTATLPDKPRDVTARESL